MNGVPVAANIGFIMCEFGLEDVSVTAVRRLGYQDNSDAQLIEEKLNSIDKTVAQMQEAARAKVEQHDKQQDQEREKRNDSEGGKREEASQDSSTVPLSSPSGNIPSSSLSSPSWGSNKSLVSSESQSDTPVPTPEPLEGDASHGRLELKTIWFNFASPPPISIHKKVDFTR